MSNLAEKIADTKIASDTQRMENATAALRRRNRCIPQAYDEVGELVAVRTLLRLGRVDEAMSRLDVALDRHHQSWRTLV